MSFKLKISLLALLACVFGANGFNLGKSSLENNSNIENKISGEILSGYAVIKSPVVDMNTCLPLCESKDLPVSPEIGKCPRAHQGLYNEKIKLLEADGDCVKIAFDSIIYGLDEKTKKVINTFWVYKKYIIPLVTLEENNLLQAVPSSVYAQEPTIFLIYPFSSEIGEVFSVGTRFKRVQEKDNLNHNGQISEYAVIIADYEQNKIIVDYIPVDCARVEIRDQDDKQARKLFVEIINNLVDRVSRIDKKLDNASEVDLECVIPYVWGGSSFVGEYPDEKFYKKGDDKDAVWHRDGKLGEIYSGYDCSELVMRMAKMSGIDFKCKTTAIMEKLKKPLAKDGKLENGDIIWIPGHVMIVSNIEGNELIEAVGYSSGYGCVRKMELKNNFDGIETYDQLLEAYYSGKPIVRLKKDGLALKKYDNFKILKLID